MNKLFTKIVGAALGLTMAIGVGVAVSSRDAVEVNAATVVSDLTFTKACGGSGTADDGTVWTVTSDGTESTFTSGNGIHYGTGSASVGYIQLATSDISGTVSKVVVNASTASGVSATASVTVGGDAFGGAAQSLSTTATNYTFEGSATAGEIVVRIAKPSKANKALYCLSVKVTYTTGGGGGGSGTSYSKVTAAPSDWSGTYLLVYQNGSTAYIWTGVDTASCYEEATITSNQITKSLTSAVTITIESMTGGYSIKVDGGTNEDKYISGVQDSNTINFGTTAVANTITFNSGVDFASNTSHMRFNSASGNMRFRYFKSASYLSQNICQLFKKDVNTPAIELTITEGTSTLGIGDTATVVATKVNGATGTISWDTGSDKISLGTPTTTESTSTVVVTGVLGGEDTIIASLTGCDDAELSFTVNKELSSIAVTTVPTKTTYTEGESFDTTGMVVTATFNDTTSSAVTDYTYSPDGALTPSVTEITISYSYNGGTAKTTTQAITVNAKTVDHINIKTLPTKNKYHAGEEFDSTGLTITVCYNAAETDILDNVASGFTISPATYEFTAADELAGSKEFTVTYGSKSKPFSVTVSAISGPIASGRYYIMHIDADGVDIGASNAYNDQATHPVGIELSTNNNELRAFTFTLVDEDTYTVMADNEHYLYASNTNNGAWVGTTEDTWEVEKVTPTGTGEYDYFTMVDNNNSRYLTSYVTGTVNDFRSYSYNSTYFGVDRVSNGQHARLMLIPEGSYADTIASKLSTELTCNVAGTSAPSTDKWAEIAGVTNILFEKNLLKAAEYTVTGSGASTVVTAKEGTSQAYAEAVAKYDYVVGKYLKGQGLTAYSDFLARDPARIGLIRIGGLFETISNGNSTSTIIIVVSMMGLAAVGGYFFLRKRKEQ